MSRHRDTHKHLPPRVYWKNGAYRYQVPALHKPRLDCKSWITLGKTESELWKSYAALMQRLESGTGMILLFERYQRDVIPTKAPRTQRDNLAELKKLQAVFGHMEPGAITQAMAYQYMDIRGKQSPTQANHEMSLLRHIFTMAARWGVVPANPLQGMRKIHIPVRDRVPSPAEAAAVQRHADPYTRLWIEFKWQTGLRLADMLKLKLADMSNEGIRIQANKNAKMGLIEWTPELRATVEKIKALNKVQGMTLFCDQRGRALKGRTMQERFKKATTAALAAGDLLEPFTENDIRSAFATASEEQGHDASNQLLHRSATAKRHYVHRKVTRVVPIKPV